MSSAAPLDLAAWLADLGLAQYTQLFADNDVDAALLPQLTADDLRDMGVTSVGHRRRLLDAAAGTATTSGAPSVVLEPRHEAQGLSPARATQAVPAESSRSGAPTLQRRPITVMFCDLVGSTALASRVDPEDLREHLNNFRNLLAQLVQGHQGWIAQYLGDGVLAYFGYPVAHEHDAEQAVSAALAIVDGLATLALLPGAPGQAPQAPQVRIGVATGLTVIGATLSADDSSEHNAVGQTPNLAARAQAMAEPNTVVVTAETRQLIGGLFECRDMGLFELKGFSEQKALWQVTRESPLASRFDALRASNQYPLIGRDDEASRILQRLAQARAGHGRLVVITGEGGMGKSRLVGHVAGEVFGAESQTLATLATLKEGGGLGGKRSPRLVFQCSPYHASTPLHSVRYYLERASGIAASDNPTQALAKIALLLQGAGDVSPTAQSVALFAELLRVKHPGDAAKAAIDALTSNERRRLTLQLLGAGLEAAARRVPLLIIEDLQWIDPSSAELFGGLLKRLSELPLLVIATARPGPLPTWLADVRSEIITLDRLDAESTRGLVRAVALPHILSAAVEDALIARSDGVPLFAEELTRAYLVSLPAASGIEAASGGENLGANGVANDVTNGGANGVKNGTSLPAAARVGDTSQIPSTLVESLLARLDRYAHGRELAPIAAVLGREMPVELLVAVCAGVTTLDRAGVLRGVRELRDAGVFVTGHSAFGGAIAFRHMLVREAAYQLLLRRERQRFHAHAAKTLETQFSAVADALPHLVALHCTEAGDTERAAWWLGRAGADANHRSAYQEAIAHYRRALELSLLRPESPERDLHEFELRKSLIAPLIAATGFQTAEVGGEISRSITLAERLGSKVSLVTTLALKWMWHGPGGDLRQRSELSYRMREAALGGSDIEKLWAHRFLGTSQVFAGHFKGAMAEYQAFIALFDEQKHAKELAYVGPSNHHLMVVVGMAEVFTLFKQTEQAQATREHCVAVANADGRLHNRCQALVFGCCLTAAVARDARALKGYAKDLYELTHGAEVWPVWGGHAELFYGLSVIADGEVDKGFELADKGVAQMTAAGAYNNVWYILHADACCTAGRVAQAQSSLDLAEPWRANGLAWFDAEFLRVRGRLRLLRGEGRAAARADYEAALRLAQEQESPLFIERAQEALAALAALQA